MVHRQKHDEELLSYDDLLSYVSSTTIYDQGSATWLWSTMTAFLPTNDPKCFIVVTSTGSCLTPEAYKAWFGGMYAEVTQRQWAGAEERMKWRVGRQLVELFEQEARFSLQKDVPGYGGISKALIVDWISSL